MPRAPVTRMVEAVFCAQHPQQVAPTQRFDARGELRGRFENAARAHEVDDAPVVASVIGLRLLVHAIDLLHGLAHGLVVQSDPRLPDNPSLPTEPGAKATKT